MILNYHMLTFTLFNLEITNRYTMGFSYLGFMGVLIIFNLIMVGIRTF